MMRGTRLLGLSLLALLSCGSLASAGPVVIGAPAGPDPFRLTFDENGNGTLQTFNPNTGAYNAPVNNPGFLMGGFLTYRLPEFVGSGDVGVLEPAGALSDGLRFLND